MPVVAVSGTREWKCERNACGEPIVGWLKLRDGRRLAVCEECYHDYLRLRVRQVIETQFEPVEEDIETHVYPIGRE